MEVPLYCFCIMCIHENKILKILIETSFELLSHFLKYLFLQRCKIPYLLPCKMADMAYQFGLLWHSVTVMKYFHRYIMSKYCDIKKKDSYFFILRIIIYSVWIVIVVLLKFLFKINFIELLFCHYFMFSTSSLLFQTDIKSWCCYVLTIHFSLANLTTQPEFSMVCLPIVNKPMETLSSYL